MHIPRGVTQPEPRRGEPLPEREPKPSEETGPLGAIDGADAGALGTAPPPETAPPGAHVEDVEHRVPGADFERPLRESKPWFTSLAFESEQAGVGNEALEEEHAERE